MLIPPLNHHTWIRKYLLKFTVGGNNWWLIDRAERPPCIIRLNGTYQRWVDSRGVGAVGKVIGVVVAGGGRGSVGRAVHPERRVQLGVPAGQDTVLVGRAAEGGRCLGLARPVTHRPGKRIAASRTGVCRHEKLHEEELWIDMSFAFAVWAVIWISICLIWFRWHTVSWRIALCKMYWLSLN